MPRRCGGYFITVLFNHLLEYLVLSVCCYIVWLAGLFTLKSAGKLFIANVWRRDLLRYLKYLDPHAFPDGFWAQLCVH